MHTFGKVLLVFVIILSGFAVYFSAKLLDQKRAWMEKAQKREAELADVTAKNRENQLVMHSKEAELHRLTLGWDKMWNNIPLNVAILEDGPPTINVDVGKDKKLIEKQQLYLFRTSGAPAGDATAEPAAGGVPPAEGAAPAAGSTPGAVKPAGASTYMGPFVVAGEPQETKSALSPDGRFTPDQIKGLSSGTVRVRTFLPTELILPFTAVQKEMLTVDEQVAATTGELKTQQTRMEAAQAEQSAREKEIEGNPALVGRTLPPEIINGLLATIAAEEEQRNSALELVKSLQTRLKDTVEKTIQLRGEIEQLVQSLPQPRTPQASREVSPR